MVTCPCCGKESQLSNHYSTCKNIECPCYDLEVFERDLGRIEDEGGIPQ